MLSYNSILNAEEKFFISSTYSEQHIKNCFDNIAIIFIKSITPSIDNSIDFFALLKNELIAILSPHLFPIYYSYPFYLNFDLVNFRYNDKVNLYIANEVVCPTYIRNILIDIRGDDLLLAIKKLNDFKKYRKLLKPLISQFYPNIVLVFYRNDVSDNFFPLFINKFCFTKHIKQNNPLQDSVNFIKGTFDDKTKQYEANSLRNLLFNTLKNKHVLNFPNDIDTFSLVHVPNSFEEAITELFLSNNHALVADLSSCILSIIMNSYKGSIDNEKAFFRKLRRPCLVGTRLLIDREVEEAYFPNNFSFPSFIKEVKSNKNCYKENTNAIIKVNKGYSLLDNLSEDDLSHYIVELHNSFSDKSFDFPLFVRKEAQTEQKRTLGDLFIACQNVFMVTRSIPINKGTRIFLFRDASIFYTAALLLKNEGKIESIDSWLLLSRF